MGVLGRGGGLWAHYCHIVRYETTQLERYCSVYKLSSKVPRRSSERNLGFPTSYYKSDRRIV